MIGAPECSAYYSTQQLTDGSSSSAHRSYTVLIDGTLSVVSAAIIKRCLVQLHCELSVG